MAINDRNANVEELRIVFRMLLLFDSLHFWMLLIDLF